MSVTSATWAPVDAWPPRTEAALAAAAKDGHLRETHILELKRELVGGDAANKELAADLASLANDGGLLFIGIDETTGPGLSPVPLAGLAERIEQVAHTRIDEPLTLTFAPPIESSTQAGHGYLVVRVPPSPRAPHMAGGRYWGRGDKTKHHLSNADVERLMARRARWAVGAEQALNEWIAKDPIVGEERLNAHLFVVADPVSPSDRLLLPVFTGNWQATFQRLVSATSHRGDAFSPDVPSGLSNFSPTPDGWAWYSYSVFGAREEGVEATGAHRESSALKLEICENGQLRLMCGRAAQRQQQQFQPERLLLIEAKNLGLTARMVSLAQRVSAEAGFLGSWDFAVGLTGLRGAISLLRFQAYWGAGAGYTEETYMSSTRAALAEIEAGSGPIVERLLGRLMRAIGADQLAPVAEHFRLV